MSFTLCTSAAIIARAGDGASPSVVASGALLALFCDEAEANLAAETIRDWVTVYSSVPANYKPLLSRIVACDAAMMIINYDASGFAGGLADAQTKLDFLRDTVTRGLTVLKEDRAKNFILAN